MNRISIITKYFYPVHGGIENGVRELYRHFDESNWEVTVHTSAVGPMGEDLSKAPASIDSITVRRYAQKLFSYWPSIDFETTDIVSLQNFDLLPHLIILFKVAMLKVVGRKRFLLSLTPHGGFNPNWPTFPFSIRVLKRTLHYCVGKYLINFAADVVLAVSEWEKQQLINKGVRAHLIFVVENGLDDIAFTDVDAHASGAIRELVSNWGDYIVQVGRLYKVKNYETAIRAISIVSSDVRLVILGQVADEKYTHMITELAIKQGVAHKVIFAGTIGGADKYYVLKHAKAMVHMSLWENYCTAVHEGMSQGLVCIVSNSAVMPYLVKHGENGYSLPVNDFRGLADKITYVLEHTNDEAVRIMKQANIRYAIKCTWSAAARTTKHIYDTLLNNSHA